MIEYKIIHYGIGINQYLSIVTHKQSGEIDLYKDGQLMGTISGGNVISDYDFDWNNIWIGRDSRTGKTALTGNISAVRIYNKTLNEREIKQNYMQDKSRYEL